MFKVLINQKLIIPIKLEINIHNYFTVKLQLLSSYMDNINLQNSICEIFYNDILEIISYYHGNKRDNLYTYLEFVAMNTQKINKHLSEKFINDKEYTFVNEYVHPIHHNVVKNGEKKITLKNILKFNMVEKI